MGRGTADGAGRAAVPGKPVPAFRLESLETPGQYYQAEVLTQGKPVLLNVWATWCPTCRAEHQYLNQLSAQGIRVVGLNYKDDRAKAVAWLKELGNPYALSLSDSDGMLGLDLGVYGAPETFLIDGRGIIRYRCRLKMKRRSSSSASSRSSCAARNARTTALRTRTR